MLGVWPVLMGVTMFIQMQMNPPPPDPIQARMFQILPIFFTFILAVFPPGWSFTGRGTISCQYCNRGDHAPQRCGN